MDKKVLGKSLEKILKENYQENIKGLLINRKPPYFLVNKKLIEDKKKKEN